MCSTVTRVPPSIGTSESSRRESGASCGKIRRYARSARCGAHLRARASRRRCSRPTPSAGPRRARRWSLRHLNQARVAFTRKPGGVDVLGRFGDVNEELQRTCHAPDATHFSCVATHPVSLRAARPCGRGTPTRSTDRHRSRWCRSGRRRRSARHPLQDPPPRTARRRSLGK